MSTQSKTLRESQFRLILVWIVLIVSTLMASLWVNEMVSIPRSVMATVIALGALKVTLVNAYYMEIHQAPAWLKLLCGTWITLVFGMILLCYCK